MLKNDIFTPAKIERSKREEITASDFSAVYSLYTVSLEGGAVYYAVEIRTEGDRTFASLGEDQRDARRIYEMIVRCAVTPCQLQDVLSDDMNKIYS